MWTGLMQQLNPYADHRAYFNMISLYAHANQRCITAGGGA